MTESSTDNKRGKRGSPKVVVVTKKRFSFSSKVNNKQLEDVVKPSQDAVKAEPQTSQALNQTHASFGGDLRKSGNKVRNLDDDIIAEKAEVAEESKKTEVKQEPKKVAKSFATGRAHLKKEVVNKIDDDFFSNASKDTSSKNIKKDKKSFLEDLTIVSDSKQKSFNKVNEASNFLAAKKGYDESQARNKNFFDDAEGEKERLRSIASIKRAREKIKRDKSGFNEDKNQERVKEVIIPETIIVDIKYDNPTKSNSLASELKVGNSLNSDISASNI